jgi:hypothetical protein
VRSPPSSRHLRSLDRGGEAPVKSAHSFLNHRAGWRTCSERGARQVLDEMPPRSRTSSSCSPEARNSCAAPCHWSPGICGNWRWERGVQARLSSDVMPDKLRWHIYLHTPIPGMLPSYRFLTLLGLC